MINIKKSKCTGRLSASLLGSACHAVRLNGASRRLAASLAAVASAMTLSGVQIPEAHAHVSHVLSAQQYGDIKIGYPEIEITAATMTGLVVIGAVFVQAFQRRGRRRQLLQC